MTPSDVSEARAALGLTQEKAATLVGVDARSWRRWEAGDVSVPEPAVRLIGLAVRSLWVKGWLMQRAAATLFD